MKRSDLAWPLMGLGAVLLSCYLLYHQVRSISLDEITNSLHTIPRLNWLLAAVATLGAYSALAWYDCIALAHPGKRFPGG